MGEGENKTGMNPKTNALLHAQFTFSCSFPCFYHEPFFPNFKGNEDMPNKVSIVPFDNAKPFECRKNLLQHYGKSREFRGAVWRKRQRSRRNESMEVYAHRPFQAVFYR